MLGYSPWPILWQMWLDVVGPAVRICLPSFSHCNLGDTQLPHRLRASLGLSRTSLCDLEQTTVEKRPQRSRSAAKIGAQLIGKMILLVGGIRQRTFVVVKTVRWHILKK
jgi:hypothetical protein